MELKIKKLLEYKKHLSGLEILFTDNSSRSDFNVDVADVSYNSKEVKKGTLFIVKGGNFKTEYLLSAIEQGACAFVCEKGKSGELISELKSLKASFAADDILDAFPFIEVSDLRKAISEISAFYYDSVWNDNLKLIGLTGTKGKSTTAFMIRSILNEYVKHEIAFSSGIFTFDGETKEKSRKLTTPETVELHRILFNAVKNKSEYLVMEVSSQGLKYDRVLNLNYTVGAFLNISEDHISAAEHRDMEDYFTSKLRIVEKSKIMVVNQEMNPDYLERIRLRCRETACPTYEFSTKDYDVTEYPGYIVMKGKKDTEADGNEYKVNIGGKYNSQNAMCAITVAKALGIDEKCIKKGLENVVVPGRMETYRLSDNVEVIVDCAHNKMSYEALFGYAKEQYPGRSIGFLFGCVGDKAYNRRKEAALIADVYSDFSVITERDPGKEPVEKICDEIYSNMNEKNKAEIIVNRDEAVKKILDKAMEINNSVVLLCGCGSDAYVKRAGGLVPFETDGERVQNYISKYLNE